MAILFDARNNEWLGALDVITNQTITDARASSANLAALNAEAVADLNGHATVVFDLRGTWVATVNFEATLDGTNYFAVPAMTQSSQAFVTTTTANGTFYVMSAGFRRVRARLSAYTSGTVVTVMRGSFAETLLTAIPYPTTLSVTTTGAAAAAVTLTVPAGGAGLFHYFTRILVQRHTSALLTAGTTPVLVTTTNLPGTRVLSFPADAAAQGTVYSEEINPSQPIKSSAANTATTIVCPATTGVIWRVTADYYLGA